jgi:hypothetical protein
MVCARHSCEQESAVLQKRYGRFLLLQDWTDQNHVIYVHELLLLGLDIYFYFLNPLPAAPPFSKGEHVNGRVFVKVWAGSATRRCCFHGNTRAQERENDVLGCYSIVIISLF